MLAEERFCSGGSEVDAEIIWFRQQRTLEFNVAWAIHRTCAERGHGGGSAAAQMEDRIALVGGVFLAAVKQLKKIREPSHEFADLGDGGRTDGEGQTANGDGGARVMDGRENVLGRQNIEMSWDIGHAFLLCMRAGGAGSLRLLWIRR